MNKYLIIGLGNIGAEYADTRHNIGFRVLDTFANEHGTSFSTDKLGARAEVKIKGRTFILIKPSTYMNLSGKAVRYHMDKEKLTPDDILVICDDLALPFGTIRIKGKGSDGGHNGLKNINEMLGSQNYPRFRFGIGDTFAKGQQVDYVLGTWTENEMTTMAERLEKASQVIETFGLAGLNNAMNTFNGK
ncbi:MAG: aminoacyl-tRNA hydrolase [Flavobacteriales bacterium]|nr:aminoacyl-tRNA hydrolase [Flavobacteriales bacterium]